MWLYAVKSNDVTALQEDMTAALEEFRKASPFGLLCGH
jgi:hypothetical protein